MRTIKLFVAIILFALAANAQADLPVIKSNADTISIQDGANLKKNGWSLAPEAKPDSQLFVISYQLFRKLTFALFVHLLGDK